MKSRFCLVENLVKLNSVIIPILNQLIVLPAESLVKIYNDEPT